MEAVCSVGVRSHREVNCKIEQKELDQALANTKLGKSPSADGILSQVLVHGGTCLRAFLLTHYNIVWATEQVTINWINVIMIILFILYLHTL